jgi:hypothetical protein
MKRLAWRRIHSTFLMLLVDQEIFDWTYEIREQAQIPAGRLLEDQIHIQIEGQLWKQT